MTMMQRGVKSRRRRSLVPGACVFGLFVVCALPLQADTWLKDPITGCQVWSPESKPDSSELVSWSGDCQDGKASGQGVLVWLEDGILQLRFEGPMVEGKAEGFGRVWLRGDSGYDHYEGQFKGSKLDGQGVYKDADGSRYEGEFRNDKPHGYGIYEGADGTRFAGELRNGEPNG